MPKSWKARVEKLVEKVGSLERLAADLGVSFFTVFRWKEGVHEPSPIAQRRIEEFEKERKG